VTTNFVFSGRNNSIVEELVRKPFRNRQLKRAMPIRQDMLKRT